MAFKVLLADDSAAIKKVVQLSLQDFGVDIKSVGSGKDVLDVCRTFKPDIALVDVLLPQKTGYEVAREIKSDNALKSTPVVMLWSAFMAFDEAKFKASGAEEKLEKPFEVSTLRGLVTRLVPRLSSNPIAKHLDFPKVEFEQPIGAVPPTKAATPVTPVPLPPIPPVSGMAAAAPTAPSISLPPIPTKSSVPQAQPSQTQKPAPTVKEIDLEGTVPKEEWSMASFEDIGTFTSQMKNLQDDKPKEPPPQVKPAVSPQGIPVVSLTPPAPSENEDWVRKDVTSRFKVPVPMADTDENSVAFQYSESEINDTSFLFKPPTGGQTSENTNATPKTDSGIEITKTAAEFLPKLAATTHVSQLSDADMQRIKQETRDAIEKVVWKIVPEIASQIIREELERLLGDEK